MGRLMRFLIIVHDPDKYEKVFAESYAVGYVYGKHKTRKQARRNAKRQPVGAGTGQQRDSLGRFT